MSDEETENKKSWLGNVYTKEYKKLLVIPFVLLFLSLCIISYQIATTGDFVKKGVSLSGGVVVTVVSGDVMDIEALQERIARLISDKDINVRRLGGAQPGVIIESNVDFSNSNDVDELLQAIETTMGFGLNAQNHSVEGMGSTLGASFFAETLKAVLLSFIFMAIVVFWYFRIPVPSIAVILAALSDILITLAVVNLLGMKLTTGGIAAFLMLIGYSVDTDILLSTRVLKRRSGTVYDAVIDAMKTGVTMSMATILALLVTFLFSQSEMLKQIMLVLLIGLIIDLINTWIQNAGILRWYLEKHNVRIREKLR